MPWLFRKILVNLIIVPLRVRKSTALYKLMWDEKGSPLLYHTISLGKKLQEKLDSTHQIFVAMRCGNPSLKTLLTQLQNEQFSEIIFVPLFPQYASSTTGSVLEFLYNEIGRWTIIPKLKFINQFYNNHAFISVFAGLIKNYNLSKYDHVVFSFHGLPLKHIDDSHPDISPATCSCEKAMPEHGAFCYKATCYQTARLLVKELNLPEDKYSISFQSRLSKDWLMPFTDHLIIEKAKARMKNILIVAPSFVSDCLETLVELEIEYGKLFKDNGGEQLTLIKGLNDSDEWVIALSKIIFE